MRRGLAGEVIVRLERRGYELRGARLLKITRALAAAHYAEHKGKPFYAGLVSFITSGPVLALAVRGENAIAGVRVMMGATNPADARPARFAATSPPSSRRTSSTARIRGRARSASSRCSSPTAWSDRRGRPVGGCPPQPGRLDRGRTPSTRTRTRARPGQGRRSRGASDGVPEVSLDTLGEVDGLDVVELGCGTAYCLGLARAPRCTPVGVDVTPAQLATARRCQQEFGLEFPLVEASAEDVPLRGASFDLASPSTARASGATRTAGSPRRHRLLRPGGRLWFLRNSTISILCMPEVEGPPGETLLRAQRGLGRLEWPDERGVEWQLPPRRVVLCSCGRRGSTSSISSSCIRRTTRSTTRYYSAFSAEWSRKWPAEEIWVAASRGDRAARPRIDVAAAAGDPRAASDPVRGRFAPATSSTIRRTPTRSRWCARTRRGRRGRCTQTAG